MTETSKRVLDARGWECPKPIIETKRMMSTMCDGEIVTMVDNKIALDNLIDYAQSQGYPVQHEEKDGVYYVTIEKTGGCQEMSFAGEATLTIAITTDCFGVGSEELGKSLMKAYLFALTEADKRPDTLIFVNKGVTLVCEDSEVLETVQALAEAGTKILACGTCLNFYGLTESLQIGTISNMYQIVNEMNNATNTIKI